MIREKDNPAHETPMMRQYFSMKEKYPRELLFFRMGDFYEMFFDDARVASDILGIALTSRSRDKEAIPMAGVPVRAVDNYLPKLLKAGRRVAICEQTEDPKKARGLVDREVVRVVSPGTITDERLVGEKANNYIASIAMVKDGYGLAWLDVTTGQFMVWETRDVMTLCAELSRIEPAEFLVAESADAQGELDPSLEAAVDGIVMTPYPDAFFDHDTAYRTLTEHFRTNSLEGFGCEHLKAAVRAGGGLMRYVQDTQKDSLKHITQIRAYDSRRYVPIDNTTRRALELTESFRGGGRRAGPTVLSCMDRTATSLGARLLRAWLLAPLKDVDDIVRRQVAVESLCGSEDLREEIVGLLRQVHDIERICTRISYGSANARDLVSLRKTLEIMPQVRRLLEEVEARFFSDVVARLDVPVELVAEISAAIVDDPPLAVKEGGYVRAGFNAELDETREIATQGAQWMARFQEEESERTGIPNLKVRYNKVFGYYIEVTNTHLERIPGDYVRKQTLKNCERFVTADLKEYEAKVLNAKERAMEIEYEIFTLLRDKATQAIPQLQAIATAVAETDVIANFATLAATRGYVRPAVNDGMQLLIEDGRHPVLDEVQGFESFIPNSVELDAGRNIMLITGPNMAGKSTYIRQVAILTLLAQTGCSIPAARAEIGVVDRVFTRVGAADDLARGQSTFMVEMNETANILNNATVRSLVILDEVGRGTSTFDGVSLAWAITEFLADNVKARTLFATHYHELTSLEALYPCVMNYSFAVKEWNDEIIFLRRIVEGSSDESYGIHVARLAGIPGGVLERAREILSNLESQAFDLHDQPKLAKKAANGGRRGTADSTSARQLDFFRNANEGLLEEVKSLDTDSMTPLEALEYLAEIRRRIV